jgi:hypothetical protein
MKATLFRLFGRLSDLVDVHPVLALFLAGAILTLFLTVLFRSGRPLESEARNGLVWLLYQRLGRLLWALMLVGFLLGALCLLRVYLHQTLAAFQRTHGRVTDANYHAVETIWGTQQEQVELQASLYYEEEVTERFESEDLTKPAITRKKTVRHDVPANTFVSAQHEVKLRQNPRKKGSALYGGYETACRFRWRLKNPSERDLSSILRFPLPAATGMYNDLSATLNGKDALSLMNLKDGALMLTGEWKGGETLDLAIGFTSRGMSSWYFQIREPREIRDFTLTLTLPDVTKERLNNPEGCMSPTATKSTPDNLGSILTYRLEHAITSKGMGIALPPPPQPGAATTAVLAETERGWLLIYAMMIFGLTIGGLRANGFANITSGRLGNDGSLEQAAVWAVVLSIIVGAATAFGYGMLADFSDLLFGFWGTAAVILAPLFAFLAWLLKRIAPCHSARLIAGQFLVFGLLYPALAGLDGERQSLYFDLSALVFLVCAAWQLAGWINLSFHREAVEPGRTVTPVPTGL